VRAAEAGKGIHNWAIIGCFGVFSAMMKAQTMPMTPPSDAPSADGMPSA
jgi:hypothetical protein